MNVQRMMVIMAHPDDVELSCYGLIRKMVSNGTICTVIIVTNGENGILNFVEDDKSTLRKEETRSAISDLVNDIVWLEMKDGSVKLDSELIGCIHKLLSKYCPQLIVTHFPDDLGVEHQDHNVIGKATINAAFKYATDLNYLLLSEPTFSRFTNFKPNCFVEISNEFESKINSLKKHCSQKNKFYMSSFFQNMRAAAITPYININNGDFEQKYELFQIIYEKII